MSADILVTTAQHSRDLFDWITAGSAVVGLIVVTAYTTLTYKQWKEASKANKLAEKAMEMASRSWIIPEIDQKAAADVIPTWIKIFMPNNGAVPALIERDGATAVISLEGGKFPETITIPANTFEKSGVIAGPKLSTPTSMYVQLPEFSAAEISSITNGTRAIIVYCEVEYTDVFEKSRKTTIGWWRGGDGHWFIAPQYSKLI